LDTRRSREQTRELKMMRRERLLKEAYLDTLCDREERRLLLENVRQQTLHEDEYFDTVRDIEETGNAKVCACFDTIDNCCLCMRSKAVQHIIEISVKVQHFI